MRKICKNKWVAACLVCLMTVFWIPMAAEADEVQNQVLLTKKNGNIEVAVAVDQAHEEKITAVSLELNVNVTKGTKELPFSFASGLKDAVTGSRYNKGVLYLYAANDTGIFGSSNQLTLGTINASSVKGALSAKISYKDGSLQTVNAAQGTQALTQVTASDAVTLEKKAETTGGSTEKPGQSNKKDDTTSKTDSNTNTSSGTTTDASKKNHVTETTNLEAASDKTTTTKQPDKNTTDDQKEKEPSESSEIFQIAIPNKDSEKQEDLEDAEDPVQEAENSESFVPNAESKEAPDYVLYIVGAVLGVALTGILIFLWRRKRRK